MNKKTISAICLVVSLAGCSNITSDNMINLNATKARTSSSLYQNINIKSLKGGLEGCPIHNTSIANDEFKFALEKSLENAHYLSANSGRYDLNVTIDQMEPQADGLFKTIVPTRIKYMLVDQKGPVIFEQYVDESYTATTTDTYLGSERGYVAMIQSVRKNIGSFIEKLSQLNT